MAKSNHWIQRVSDQVEQYAIRKKGEHAEIVCASGISPSGVIHLGNLREIMTVHLVTEELKRRGKKAVHLHFWDDYDRFRKVPANIPGNYSTYIGLPLSKVPDPFEQHASYAEHFMKEFISSLEKIGVEPTYIRQSEAYQKGIYTPLIKEAIQKRLEIFDILNRYQTEEQQKNAQSFRNAYYPFKVYCQNCGKDDTDITGTEADATIMYTCKSCGFQGSQNLDSQLSGKLVWKVDWPMRWKYYEVDFEPGGVDHSTPGSSYTVGKEIVKEIFNYSHPFYVGYSFVGITGGADKISSSAGTNATPANALGIIEPAILRWLYVRTDVKSSFNINFDDQVYRMYDEWDRLMNQALKNTAEEQEQFIFKNCIQTSNGNVAYSDMPVPFRLLTSTSQITQGNQHEIYRIVNHHLETSLTEEEFSGKMRLRLACARFWIDHFLPDDERLVVKSGFDQETFASFSDQIREAITILANEYESHWSLKELTNLMYNIPKRLLGLPADTKPNEELKQLQHSFFNALYKMLLGREIGPRLPTLFLSIGKEKLGKLLSPFIEN